MTLRRLLSLLLAVLLPFTLAACTPSASQCTSHETFESVTSFATMPLMEMVAREDVFWARGRANFPAGMRMFDMQSMVSVNAADLRAADTPHFSKLRNCAGTLLLTIYPKRMEPIKAETQITYSVGQRENARVLVMSANYFKPMIASAKTQALAQLK